MKLARELTGSAFLLAALAMPITVNAQDTLPDPGLVEILPAGGVVGDGETTVTMHVVAFHPDGSAITGLKLRPSASQGSAEGWSEVGDGLYSFHFIPPSLETSGNVAISVKGRLPSRDSVDASVNVPIQAHGSNTIAASANPATIVLGQTSEATLSFEISGPDQQFIEGADLVISASSGEVTNLTSMGAGRFTARYVTPRVNYPHLAIISVTDSRDPANVHGHLTIPLKGAVDYPIQASPNSTVILRVNDREFGPIQANPQGRASVPIIVDPGVNDATMVSIVAGESREDPIDLRVPETLRILLMPTSATIPADSQLGVPIRAIAVTPDGKPDALARLTFTSTAGRFDVPTYSGNGVYTALFHPPNSKAQMAATVQVELQGSSIQTGTMELRLIPARATGLSLSSEPEVLHESGTGLRVFATVTGSDGNGLTNRSPSFKAIGATSKGAVQDLKGGDYRADFSATGNTDVDVYAIVKSAVSSNSLDRVIVLPGRDTVPNDGTSSLLVTVVTLDEFGYPVPNVDVALSTDASDGTFPSQVRTDSHGIGHLFYSSGRTAELVRFTARSGDDVGTAAVLQSDIENVVLAASGTVETRDIINAWNGIRGAVHVERQGDSVVAAAPVAEGEMGKLSALSVTAEPAMAAPGGTVTLVLTASDAAGRGVAGERFDLLCTSGTFGVISDLGGGTYQTTFQAPADAEEPVKISVMHANANAMIEIPITDPATTGDAWDSANSPGWGELQPSATDSDTTPAEAEAAATTVAEAPAEMPASDPKPARVPREPQQYERPWMRARVSGVLSSYTYEQTPSESPGSLLTDALAVGGDGGGRAATPLGMEMAATAWLESIPYLGFHANFRWTRYAISSSVFSSNVADSIYNIEVDVAGRYPIQIGNEQFHVGGRLGFRYDDFVLFEGCLDPGCGVDYSPVGIAGMVLGIEVGAELEKAFVTAALSEGFGNFTQPYSTTIDANIGYNFHPNVFADIGFTGVFRSIDLEGADSGLVRGSIRDTQIMAKAGVGISL